MTCDSGGGARLSDLVGQVVTVSEVAGRLGASGAEIWGVARMTGIPVQRVGRTSVLLRDHLPEVARLIAERRVAAR